MRRLQIRPAAAAATAGLGDGGGADNGSMAGEGESHLHALGSGHFAPDQAASDGSAMAVSDGGGGPVVNRYFRLIPVFDLAQFGIT
jgi:hypothetical protein